MIQLQNLRFSYPKREVLKGVSFSVQAGEIFGLLGPNGCGKTTLFRILATLLAPSSGNLSLAGIDPVKSPEAVREVMGIVFQSPSVDARLTVEENLKHQGHLYGLTGAKLKERAEELLGRLGLQEIRRELASKLSGGMKRRVELAKGLLHRPKILILDEPSTGLDPGARIDLWNYLGQLREREGMTILLTTHLMDEAEACGRVAILNQGAVTALGSPDELKSKIGGGVIVLRSKELNDLQTSLEAKFQVIVKRMDGELHVEHPDGAKFAAKVLEAFPGRVEAITFRKPTLEDVFVHETGHRFWSES